MLPPSWKRELQESIEKQTQREKEEREAQEANRNRAVTAAICAIKKEVDTHSQKYASGEKRKIFFDVVGAIFVAATAAFTGLSWWVFSGQLTEMKETFATDRAYIFADGIRRDRVATLAPGYTVTVHFKNLGRTPAIISDVAAACKWFAHPPPAIFPGATPLPFDLVIAAGDSAGDYPAKVLAADRDIEQAKAAHGSIRCLWNISYSDVRANKHTSSFCLLYDFGLSIFIMCPEAQYHYRS